MSEMKAFAYRQHGNASVAEVLTLPTPEVTAPTAMRVKVHACAFNPIDYKRREGQLKMIMPEKTWPVILGFDAAGMVDIVGSAVEKFKPGDEVYFRIGKDSPHPPGTCAEYTLVNEDLAAPKPKNMSFEEAAACPLAAITALQMLRKAGMKQGDSVFINAGAGGVGHFAIQLAKALGASRVVATASAAKHALLKELGCDEVVDYRTQDYTQLYASRPFDIALDNVSEVPKLCNIVKEGGWIVSVTQGFSNESFTEAGLPSLGWVVRTALYLMRWRVNRAVASAKINFFGLFLRPNAEDLKQLTEYIEAGKVKAVIQGNVFLGIEQAPAAMAALEGGRTTGKVVVKIV